MGKFKKCCAVGTDGVPTLEVSMERYEQLIEAEVKLRVIKEVAEAEDGNFGYSTKASETIDTILGIERNAEEK